MNYKMFFCVSMAITFMLLGAGITKCTLQAAELQLPRHGKHQESLTFGDFESGDLNKFGRYADHYYARRWKRMCNGPARYDAMREANDLGKANPC